MGDGFGHFDGPSLMVEGAVEATAAVAPFCCMHACMEQYPGGRAPGQGVHA